MDSKELIDQLLIYVKDALNFMCEYSTQATAMSEGFTKLVKEIQIKLADEAKVK